MADRTLYRITLPGSGYPPGTFFLTDDKENCVQVEYVRGERPGKWRLQKVTPFLIPITSIAPYSTEVSHGSSNTR